MPAVFTLGEALILGAGWLIALFTGIYSVFVSVKTPANTFLRAWWNGTAVVFAHDRSGEGFFEAATKMEKGFIDSPRLGHIMLTEGSHVNDAKSKLPVFTAFTEYATSIPVDYPAVLQELRETGFALTKWKDYKEFLDAAQAEDRDALRDLLAEDVDDEEQAVSSALEGVTVSNEKTYKASQLADMFPNNIHPSMLEAKIENEVQRRIDNDGTDWTTIGGWATVILAICIGGAVAYEMSQGSPGQVTCEVVERGVRNATEAASSNITV